MSNHIKGGLDTGADAGIEISSIPASWGTETQFSVNIVNQALVMATMPSEYSGGAQLVLVP